MFKVFSSKVSLREHSQPKIRSQKLSNVSRLLPNSIQAFSKDSFFSCNQAKYFSNKISPLMDDAALIATTQYDPVQHEGIVQISEVATIQKKLNIPPLRGPKSPIIRLNFNRSGTRLLAATAEDNQLYLWQLSSETPQAFTAPGQVLCVACNQEGTLLAVAFSLYVQGRWQSKLQVINVNDPEPINLYDVSGNQYFKQNVFSLVFDPKSTRLVSGHDGNIINVWDVTRIEKGKINKATPIKIEGVVNVTQLVFDSTGNKLAGGNRIIRESEEGGGSTGFILDFNTHQQIQLRTLEYWSNTCIAFSADDQYLVTGGHYRRDLPLRRGKNVDAEPLSNAWYSVARLWDTNGKWLNEDALHSNSYFFGYRQHFTSFVSFNDKSDKIVFVDTNGFVHESDLEGKSGGEIGSFGNNVMGFCYPDKSALTLEEKPKTTPKP